MLAKKSILMGLISVSLLAGCEYTADELGAELRGAVVVGADADVTAFRYTIEGCNSDFKHEEERDLLKQTLPGNLEALQNNPLAEGSIHGFADLFKVLEPGCYNVKVQPLTESGDNSTVCAAAFENDVTIEAGKTTEIFLLSQCEGQDPGAIDIIAALNHEPELVDLRFVDSKFSCGVPTTVCATVEDSNHDPIEYEFVVPESCRLVGDIKPNDQGEHCADIECNAAGRYEISFRAYDLAYRGHELIRIEDWLKDKKQVGIDGKEPESRCGLDFPVYFDAIEAYEDVDGDGFGGAHCPKEFFCGEHLPEGYVENNDDCNDEDPEIHPDAEELCQDHVDNNCNGKVDEACE